MSKKIIIVLLIVLIIVVGAVAVLLLTGDKEENKPVVYYEYTMETQYSNIKPKEENSKPIILKYSCAIQYTDDKLETVIEKNLNELKNEFRKYFMSKNSEQLSRVDRVQQDLVEIATNVLDTNPETVTDIFFTDFIMQ